jgi:phosphatidylinositol 4-kinase type 2
VSTFL